MKRLFFSFRLDRQGQSLVEFAVSLTVMLILLAGTVDFGIGLFHYIAMRDAAQEGALYGSINPPPYSGNWSCPNTRIAEICARIVNSSGEDGIIKKLYDNGMTITIGVPEGACEGNRITATLSYNYPLTMPFIGPVIGSDYINLRASVTDVILTPPCP